MATTPLLVYCKRCDDELLPKCGMYLAIMTWLDIVFSLNLYVCARDELAAVTLKPDL